MKNNEKPFFSTFMVIESSILNCTKINWECKGLYSIISSLSELNDKKVCYATNNYLSKAMNLSTRQVQRYLGRLKALGFIEISYTNASQRIIKTTLSTLIYQHEKIIKKNELELFDYNWLHEEDF